MSRAPYTVLRVLISPFGNTREPRNHCIQRIYVQRSSSVYVFVWQDHAFPTYTPPAYRVPAGELAGSGMQSSLIRLEGARVRTEKDLSEAYEHWVQIMKTGHAYARYGLHRTTFSAVKV